MNLLYIYLPPFLNQSIVHIIGKLLWIGNGIGLGHLLSGTQLSNRHNDLTRLYFVTKFIIATQLREVCHLKLNFRELFHKEDKFSK